jgi:hypothetical protein
LKGEFAGQSLVKIEVKKVGDKKQLVFNGRAAGQPVDDSPPPSAPEPVGAGAPAASGAGETPLLRPEAGGP